MKAIVVHEYGEPEVMKLADVLKPDPSADQVLVKIEASGVNPVDTYLRSGNHAHAPKLPYTPGKDAAGFVESIGDECSKFKPGDRVYTADSLTGTYADYALCRENQLGNLPDNVGFEEGAGVWTPYATSFRALFQKAKAKSGETVLIHGASGGVGIACVQWAKNAGLKTIGTAGSDKGKELVAQNGADIVLDHGNRDYLEQIKSATNGSGVDIIVEMLANENLQSDFEVLGMNGRIVVVGNRGELVFNPRVTMTKDATILGMSLFNSSQEARDEIHTAIFAGLSDGFLKPHVKRSFPLADAAAAHREVIESKALGKIVLLP